MKVQEIFDNPAIKEIEEKMLFLQTDADGRFWLSVQNCNSILQLMEVRKRLLDDMFIMDEHYKQLLSEFNEVLKANLIDMREREIEMVRALIPFAEKNGCMIEANGKCFLGYDYTLIHPVQTERAKKVWNLLNGTYENYQPMYDDGAALCYLRWEDGKLTSGAGDHLDSENELLYLSEKIDNWNECLDKDLTADMHLIYPFHNLWSHMEIFSIFDLLWVRDFNIELNVECDYSSQIKNSK